MGELGFANLNNLVLRIGRTLNDFMANQDGDTICENHQTMSNNENFEKDYKHACLWPDHKKGIRNIPRNKIPVKVSLENVQKLWKFRNKLVLYGGRVCTKCQPRMNEMLRDIRKEVEANSVAQAEADLMDQFEGPGADQFEDPGAENDGSSSSQSSYEPEIEDVAKECKDAINRMLILQNIKHKVKDTCYEDVISVQRQNEILRNAGSAITAVLHTIYAKKKEDGSFDDGTFWKKIIDSKVVDKFLDNPPPPSTLMQEVIKYVT